MCQIPRFSGVPLLDSLSSELWMRNFGLVASILDIVCGYFPCREWFDPSPSLCLPRRVLQQWELVSLKCTMCKQNHFMAGNYAQTTSNIWTNDVFLAPVEYLTLSWYLAGQNWHKIQLEPCFTTRPPICYHSSSLGVETQPGGLSTLPFFSTLGTVFRPSSNPIQTDHRHCNVRESGIPSKCSWSEDSIHWNILYLHRQPPLWGSLLLLHMSREARG